MQRPPGRRYSQLYIEHDEPLEDSRRARNRVASLLQEFEPGITLGMYVEREMGVRLTDHGYYWTNWDQLIQSASVRDFLDLITEVFNGLHQKQYGGEYDAKKWLAGVRRIFAEEHLAYAIDDRSIVHPAVDAEFQRNRTSALAGLQHARYANVRQEFERISDALSAPSPSGKQAWRAVFAAAEGLFKLMFPASPRLTGGEVDARLRPFVQQRYGADPAAARAADRLVASLKDWVDASHNYRHEQGSEDPVEPPLEAAILAVSQGASFIRWLVTLDAVALK